MRDVRAGHPAPQLQALGRHRDGHSVGEGVEDGRVCRTKLAEVLQLFVGNVGLDLEVDADSLIAVANTLVEFQKSLQINITFQRRLHFVDMNAARCRVIDHG